MTVQTQQSPLSNPTPVILQCPRQENTAWLGVDDGAWVQAGATVVGIVVTVALAVGIEWWKRGADRRADLRRLADVMNRLTAATNAAAADIPEDSTVFANYERALEIGIAFKTAIEMYGFVRAEVRVADLDIWNALGFLDGTIASHAEKLSRELKLLETGGHNDQVYQISRREITAAAESMRPVATAIRNRLN